MTQIPAILIAASRSVSESAPVAEDAADTSGSGTFDAALALAVGQFAAPVVRPLDVSATLPDGTHAVVVDENVTSEAAGDPAADGMALPLPVAGTHAQTLVEALVTRTDVLAPNAGSALRVAPDVANLNAAAAEVAAGATSESEVRAAHAKPRAIASDAAMLAGQRALVTDGARAALTASQTLSELEATTRVRIAAPVPRMPMTAARDGDPAGAPVPAEPNAARSLLAEARGNATPMPAKEALVVPPTEERATTTIGAALREANATERANQAAVSRALPGAERGEDPGLLGARVVSSAISGEPADSRAAKAGLKRAARGAAIAVAVSEGVKAASGARSGGITAQPVAVAADAAPRAAKDGMPHVRGAQRENSAEPPAPVVTDERAVARETAQLAASGAAIARTSESTAKAAVAPLAVMPEEPLLAPRTGDRVTLNLQGENGVEGRLRVAMRGEQVHATLVANDGTTVENWTAGLDQLRRALGERGFAEPRLAIQQAIRTDVTDTHAPERGEQRAPREGQRDPHSGGTSRESQEERHARRQPRQQSQKEPS